MQERLLLGCLGKRGRQSFLLSFQLFELVLIGLASAPFEYRVDQGFDPLLNLLEGGTKADLCR